MSTNQVDGQRSDIPPTQWIKRLLLVVQSHELLRWALYCLAVGIVAGVGALIFTTILNLADSWLLGSIAHYEVPRAAGEGATYPANGGARWWAILLLPALGGLLTGLLVYNTAPEAEGHGTDAVIDAFHNKHGRIRPIVPLIKMVASALTIGTGGSAGREGPIAQIGAGFGSVLGQVLRLPPADVRRLLIIGAGAGIGAVFRAPLGGALFAASVPYRETDYEHSTLVPGIIASVTSYAVYSLLAGMSYEPIFRIDQALAFQIRQLPFFFLAGLVLIPLAMLYIWTFYRVHGLFKRLPLPRYIVPAVGGLLLGLLALWQPAVLGVGYGWVQRAIDGNLTVQFMLLIAVLKILATSLTIGSGGSGGVFAPSLVIGGLAGGAMGMALHQFMPAWFPHPGAFVLVGMAAFFATVAKTPIASLVLISEMSGGYALLVPAMLAIATAYMFSGLKWSIYQKQVLNRFASPAHRGSYVVDVLENVSVQEILKSPERVATVQPTSTLADLSSLVARTRQSIFPVVEERRRYAGAISLDLLNDVSSDLVAAGLIIAVDLAEHGAQARPADNLNIALERLQRSGWDELPVVDEEGCFRGLVSRRDVLAAYYSRLKEMRGG